MSNKPLSVASVVGTDLEVPIYEPDDVWRQWEMDDIYFGTVGSKKHVPKVRDYVIDVDSNELYIVVAVDMTTYIPTLKRVKSPALSVDLSDDEGRLLTGTITRNYTRRIYLDTSVNPHTLSVDHRFHLYGSMVTHVQIIKGTNGTITGAEKVVSMVLDQTGNIISQNVPLELCATAAFKDNKAIWSVPTCYTTTKMPNGEICVVIAYNDEGSVVSRTEFIVENTAVLRQRDQHQKYIKDISLESPFLSDADPNRLQFPMNGTLRGINLFGVVHYSDGSKKRVAVDGTQFNVLGLRDYISTIVGEEVGFFLRYNLSSDEVAYRNSVNGSERFLMRPYTCETVVPDGSYAVKLYGYPEWVDAVTGYRMRYFMLNLDRNQWTDVTSHVYYNDSVPDERERFNGTKYGPVQRLSLRINLKAVNNTYKDYQHTQIIDVQLQRGATDKTNYPWAVSLELNSSPYYGLDNWAMVTFYNQNLKKLNITCGETKFKDWLDRVWKRTYPMFDSQREAYAPEPNMFKIIIGNNEHEYNISDWNRLFELSDVFDNTKNIYIVFFRRTSNTDMFVGVSALPIFVV